MKPFEHLRWSVDDEIATVTMDRPPVNAVNQRMYGELRSAFGSGSPLVAAAKVIVLNGAGPHFCAGNDLTEFGTLSPDNADQRMAEVRAAFFAIQDCPIPVVAAVNGAALGTGLAIAASCDFVIAAANARFGTPEVGVGVMGAARHLARLLPEPWVRWMYLTAESLSAEEMRSLGAVREVVPATELEEGALRHAPSDSSSQHRRGANSQASLESDRDDGSSSRLYVRAEPHHRTVRPPRLRRGPSGNTRTASSLLSL